jgi:hypothetical protein
MFIARSHANLRLRSEERTLRRSKVQNLVRSSERSKAIRDSKTINISLRSENRIPCSNL